MCQSGVTAAALVLGTSPSGYEFESHLWYHALWRNGSRRGFKILVLGLMVRIHLERPHGRQPNGQEAVLKTATG